MLHALLARVGGGPVLPGDPPMILCGSRWSEAGLPSAGLVLTRSWDSLREHLAVSLIRLGRANPSSRPSTGLVHPLSQSPRQIVVT